MEKKRCAWASGGNTLYKKYHDEEWGIPVHGDKKIFEFLTLESAQAGLNWGLILKKRPGYRKAFANFNPKRVAAFTQKDVTRLLKDKGIIRNRLKIEAAISNAQRFLEIQKEFGSFDTYMWKFVGGKPIVHIIRRMGDYHANTKESEAMAKDMKERGFRFFGPTICYAHMQAVGIVNDHMAGCFRSQKRTRR